MKLLFIVPYAPSHIRSRSFNFLKYLARRSHEITLGTICSSPDERAPLAELEALGIRVLSFPLPRTRILQNLITAVAAGVPLQARYSWQPALAAAVREVQADVVHVEHLRGAFYGAQIQQRSRPLPPIIWDSVDSISYLFEQAARKSISGFGKLASRLELNRTRRYESRMVQQFDQVVVNSAGDRQALLALNGNGARQPQVHVVHNGVDAAVFHPIDDPVQPDTIVFTGKMSYHANVTAVVRFAREVMPLVWQERPAARLWIVGKNPDRQVQRLAEDRRIEVLGEVAEMRPYLGQAAVSVAPIAYGAGIQNKIIEAMACRTPVVSTPLAASALQAEFGRELLVAEDPQAFARQVVRLLVDQNLRTSVAEAGYLFVRKNYRWESSVSQLENIYHEAIQPVV